MKDGRSDTNNDTIGPKTGPSEAGAIFDKNFVSIGTVAVCKPVISGSTFSSDAPAILNTSPILIEKVFQRSTNHLRIIAHLLFQTSYNNRTHR